MELKKYHRLLLLTAMMVVASLHSRAQLSLQESLDMVRQEYRVLDVSYSNGKKEKQALEFTGYILVRWWESGSASTWEHIFDTRRCHWEIQIFIRQKVCHFPDGNVRDCPQNTNGKQVFIDSFSASGRDVAEMSNLSAENCGECSATREGTISQMRKKLVDHFVEIMDAKTEEYRHLLKTDQQAVRVNILQY